MTSPVPPGPAASLGRSPTASRPAARLVVRFGPADVGRRVSLRTRDASADGPREVVGTLEGWAGTGPDARLTVRRRGGDVVTLSAADLAGGLVVAPEWGAYDLQVVTQRSWQPRDTRPYGDWELRWDPARTGRATSARAGADPGTDPAGALGAVTTFSAERDARPLLQTPHPSPYDDVLEAAGWPIVRRVDLLVATTADLLQHKGNDRVSIAAAEEPDDAWVAAMDEPEPDRPDVVTLLRRTRPAVYLTARDADGATLGIARACRVTGAGRRAREPWVSVTSVHTLPAARRRGIATALMRAVADWADRVGSPRLVLQVLHGNEPALALYAGLGFARHHTYVYRSPEPGDVP